MISMETVVLNIRVGDLGLPWVLYLYGCGSQARSFNRLALAVVHFHLAQVVVSDQLVVEICIPCTYCVILECSCVNGRPVCACVSSLGSSAFWVEK